MNTIQFPYSYSVELYNNSAPDNRFIIGKPEIASTLYPDVQASDNSINLRMIRNVPWMNYENIIYRFNNSLNVYDSIGMTSSDFYTDANLINGQNYCYKIIAKGRRFVNGAEYFTENISHVACGIPVDNIPPCPPLLNVLSNCDSAFNALSWTNEDLECADDIVKYYIYYTPQLDLEYILLDSTTNTNYFHRPDKTSTTSTLAGCYYITAIDSAGNQSVPSTSICVDECYSYEIPNVFTPDGDGINDVLHPFPYQFVDQIDLKIFNRWGQLIYQTADPDINWDGKIDKSNQTASTGVYYYICDVWEKRLTGSEIRNIVGFIHLYSDKNSSNSEK
jgi:gliding motility-associated-like protein